MELESACILHLMVTAATAATTADGHVLNQADAAFHHVAAAAGAEQDITAVGLLSSDTVIDAVCQLLQPIFERMSLPFMLVAATRAVEMETRLTQPAALSASSASGAAVQPHLLGEIRQVPPASVQPASPQHNSHQSAAAAGTRDESPALASPGGDRSTVKSEAAAAAAVLSTAAGLTSTGAEDDTAAFAPSGGQLVDIDTQSAAGAAAAAVLSTTAGWTATVASDRFTSTWAHMKRQPTAAGQTSTSTVDDTVAFASFDGQQATAKALDMDIELAAAAAAASAAVMSTTTGRTSTVGTGRFMSTWACVKPEAETASTSSKASVGVQQTTKPRRLPTVWSSSEERDLVAGVEECGPGKWTEIKLRYFTNRKPERTSQDLKDKWRVLSTNSLRIKKLKKKC
jgi:hypothetical protein